MFMKQPYVESPQYVGFQVASIKRRLQALAGAGARVLQQPKDAGGGLLVVGATAPAVPPPCASPCGLDLTGGGSGRSTLALAGTQVCYRPYKYPYHFLNLQPARGEQVLRIAVGFVRAEKGRAAGG